MDLNRLTRDADDLIRKVVSRYNQLYIPSGTISQLELDLILDDLRKLYDTFKNIGYLNLALHDNIAKPEVMVNAAIRAVDTQPATQTPQSYYSKDHFKTPEPAQTPPEPMQETEPDTAKDPDYVAKQEYKSEPEIIVPVTEEAEFVQGDESAPDQVFESQVQPISELPKEQLSDNEISENAQPVNPDPAPAMLADRFNTGNKSLSETMASGQPHAFMGSRIQFQPIANLISGIGLNDKFSFISDLFGNSASNYEEAIQRINKAVNIDEANWILQKYRTPAWELNTESLARLKDFVKRRFI